MYTLTLNPACIHSHTTQNGRRELSIWQRQLTFQHHDDELLPTQTEGYKVRLISFKISATFQFNADAQVGEAKTMAELAALDQEDESLQRWKASLGLTGGAGGSGKKEVVPVSLFLTSPTRPGGDITLDLTLPPADIAKLKKDPSELALAQWN